MDLFTFSLSLGAVGLGVMAIAGLGGRGGSHAHHGAHHGHSLGHGAHNAPAPGAPHAHQADALSEAKMVTFSSGDSKGAAETTTNNIASVIQTVLAAQLVTRGGVLDGK